MPLLQSSAPLSQPFSSPALRTQQGGGLRLSLTTSDSNVTLYCSFAVMDQEGNINPGIFSVTPSATYTVSVADYPLPLGWLTRVSLFATPSELPRGVVYGSVDYHNHLSKPLSGIHRILSSYVSDEFKPNWPPGVQEHSLSGHGRLRVLSISNPSAGADISQAVPSGARWLPLALQATLTTDANVATRIPFLLITDGSADLALAAHGYSSAASNAVQFSFSAGSHSHTGTPLQTWSLIHPFHLYTGWTIGTETQSIQVGDQWSAIRLTVEEWLEHGP